MDVHLNAHSKISLEHRYTTRQKWCCCRVHDRWWCDVCRGSGCDTINRELNKHGDIRHVVLGGSNLLSSGDFIDLIRGSGHSNAWVVEIRRVV